jgi:hypothetical protein
MSSIERYLKQRFERAPSRSQGHLQGAEEGQGLRQGRRREEEKGMRRRPAQVTGQAQARSQAQVWPIQVVSQDGLAPLKRKKPAAE